MSPLDTPAPPLDEADRRLSDNVRPAEWRNPQPQPRYDLVVVGAGTGGLVSAAGAAGLGARVALVERHAMGGDCLNVGCVPSKALIASARNGMPFGEAMARMRRLRADLSAADSVARFADLGVDVFLGHGRFINPAELEVAGQRLRFRRAIIATGGRPAVPSWAGLAEGEYLTNESVFSLAELPRSMVIVGAGPIGCEMAQTFARFGSRVTLMDLAPRVLPRDDPDAAELVARALVADGVTLELGVRIERVVTAGGEWIVRGHRDSASVAALGGALLLAVGRMPNIEDLGVSAAGVDTEKTGIVVNDRLQTTNPRIFAVGDVCSRFQFTHAADAQARIALGNALFFGRRRHTRLVLPWCTYTAPEVAQVGLTAQAAAAGGVPIDTIAVPFDRVDRAVLEGSTTGFLRVHLRKGSDRIVGATIVHARAGELIAEAAAAMTNRLGLAALGGTVRPYPTLGDAYRKAADVWNRNRLTPRVRGLLRWWFRSPHKSGDAR